MRSLSPSRAPRRSASASPAPAWCWRGTDFGGARHRLATQLAGLAQEISAHFLNAFALAGPSEAEARDIRRELTRRVIALDVTVDEVLGEASDLRPHSPRLECATSGLLSTLSAWRMVARHLKVLPLEQGKREAALIRDRIPQGVFLAAQANAARIWRTDPVALQKTCLAGAEALVTCAGGHGLATVAVGLDGRGVAGIGAGLEWPGVAGGAAAVEPTSRAIAFA